MRANTIGGSDDAYWAAAEGSAVAICQNEYCSAEHCDIGGGTCSICVQVKAGADLCGYCGREMPETPRICG